MLLCYEKLKKNVHGFVLIPLNLQCFLEKINIFSVKLVKDLFFPYIDIYMYICIYIFFIIFLLLEIDFKLNLHKLLGFINMME